MSDRKAALLIYLFCTTVYALTAGPRLLRPSSDTHFVYQAESWLARRLDLGRQPPHQNDWAEVEHLTLRDGTTLAGQFLRAAPGRFRTLDGRTRPLGEAEIATRARKYYVSFPPFPAVLMLPLTAIFHQRTNDVVFTVLLAGLVPALLFLLLRRLLRAVGAPRSDENLDQGASRVSCLWLTALFGFGSVFYFSAVLGQVWFTAHVVSLVLCALYFLCALPPRRPLLAGLCVGALYLTRPQMAALGLLYVWQLLQEERKLSGRFFKQLSLFLFPCGLMFAAGCIHNYLRFGRLLEFGHSYLTTMQADNIQRFGLLNYQYLPRNLAAALCLLPRLLPAPPYVQISYHGLSLWFTTPALFCLLWPEKVSSQARDLAKALAVCVIPVALAGLLYQNDGYIQFGYRFSLDYMLPLVLLLLILRPAGVTTLRFRALVIWGIAVNLFGAITFGRMWQFYWNGFFPVL